MLFRPRDIVGGDFYTFVPDPRGFVIAVADCTGHGVPGAFMTMSASAILEQLLAKLGPEDPAAILGEVNRALKSVLHQNQRHQGLAHLDNGLDMALVRVLPREGRLLFAGARLPLWVRQPGEALREFRGDAHSLGYRRSDTAFAFANHAVTWAPGTSCYLLTDGILDQHGGLKGFGFGQRRLKAVLHTLRDLPLAEQGKALEWILDEYRGGNPQRDDITLLGFRLDPKSGQERFDDESL